MAPNGNSGLSGARQAPHHHLYPSLLSFLSKSSSTTTRSLRTLLDPIHHNTVRNPLIKSSEIENLLLTHLSNPWLNIFTFECSSNEFFSSLGLCLGRLGCYRILSLEINIKVLGDNTMKVSMFLLKQEEEDGIKNSFNID
ncbi:hypothetical protein YC2023_101862 [Brassica napus]